MSDQEKKQETSITPLKPDTGNKESCELSEEELKNAAGGVGIAYEEIKFEYNEQKD